MEKHSTFLNYCFQFFLQVKTLHVHSAIAKKYTCNVFIELTPGGSNTEAVKVAHCTDTCTQ